MNWLLFMMLSAWALQSAFGRPPNFVVILADDIGFECVGAHGSEAGLTPRLDRLAAAGMRFDSCLATPMCTTSRAMLLSGKYNFRNYERWAHLDAAETTVADLLRAGGYVTGMAGKWHLGNWEPDTDGHRGPARMGFDHYLSEITGESSPDPAAFGSPGNRFWNTRLIQDGSVRDLPPDRFSEDELADHAAAFFRAHRDRPFFYHFLPTLLDLAGIDPPEKIDGISFRYLLENPDAVPKREVAFSWGAMDGRNLVFHNPVARRNEIIHAARDARWRYLSDDRLFDVETDPLMAAPVAAGSSPDAAAARLRLKAALDSHLASKPRLW
jgi:arylsulfatase A-like enzyme